MSSTTTTRDCLMGLLEPRLDAQAAEYLGRQLEEVRAGLSDTRFAALLSRASRFSPRAPLAPSDEECAAAGSALEGWNPERWLILEAWRVALVLARPDLAELSAQLAIEEAFRFADEGEARALYRCLAHLPAPERFAWRAGEGCRTNIVPVFEAVACDTPYAFRHFDDLAWNQLAIKAVFIDAPLWRVFGLDQRLSAELARMALDLVDERRSAGRAVQHELWLCLGEHGGARGRDALLQELEHGPEVGRRAAAVALVRAGEEELLERGLAGQSDEVVALARAALEGACDQGVFRHLDPRGAVD